VIAFITAAVIVLIAVIAGCWALFAYAARRRY
jgi:hypothetical protein